MAGYGYYSGVGSSPYYVGQDDQQAGQSAGVKPAEWDPNAGAIVPKETQAQMTPGAYGSASYASMMPQWMQDYFDAQNVQNGAGLDFQRSLAMEQLPQLQKQYGMNAAMNPYFTQQAGVAKGFDPFNNNVFTTDTSIENPTTQKFVTTKHNPFSGASLGEETYYGDIQGPPGQPRQTTGYDALTAPYTGKDFRRDAMTAGLYSQATRGAPALAQANMDIFNRAKKLW